MSDGKDIIKMNDYIHLPQISPNNDTNKHDNANTFNAIGSYIS